MTKTSLYIHIPFCKTKCNYCDFYSISPNADLINKYIEQLIVELNYYGGKNIILDTIYLGGGTPSLLSMIELEKLINTILKTFVCNIQEFTIEVNPCSSANIKYYKDIGINRISLGVQSLDDKVLKTLSRSHSAKEALLALENASKYFENVSADLIVGVMQKQKIETDIKKMKDFVKHISAYILKLEQGTPLHNLYEKKEYLLLDDDITVMQYDKLLNSLSNFGLNRYEISNFSVDGYQSKHNLKYWQMGDYIGVGVSAHSFFEHKRYYNVSSIKDYLKGHHIANNYHLKEQTNELLEAIILGLRLEKGLNIKEINNRYGIDFYERYSDAIKRIKPYVVLEEKSFRIKPEFMLLQNSVVREFV